MNIFVTHPSPVLSAHHLDNRRLNKMVIETAQLLCAAHHLCGGTRSKKIYKLTHQNHPCAIWVRETYGNYDWTYRYFAALAAEYTSRSGKDHATWELLGEILSVTPRKIPIGTRSPFVNCTPHKEILDVYEAYQVTLLEKWAKDSNPKWGDRIAPPF